jgi:site-specific recombinase XerD
MDGSSRKSVTPLGATVLLADASGDVHAAGLLLSWGGGRSLQTVLCTTRGAIERTVGVVLGRSGLQPLQELVTGDPIDVGGELKIAHIDKHAVGGAGWPMRDSADGPSWSVGSLGEGSPVFVPRVAALTALAGRSTVLLEGHVAGRMLPDAADSHGRFVVGSAGGRVLPGTPVFARRRTNDSRMLLIGIVDGTGPRSDGLLAVVPVTALLATSTEWKRDGAGALPNLRWAGRVPGEYTLNRRIAEFLKDNAASGKFSKATIAARRQDLLNLDRWAASRGLDVVTLTDAQLGLYFDERADLGRSAATLTRERGSIERFYEHMVEKGARSVAVQCPAAEGGVCFRPRTVLTVREVRRVLDFDGGRPETALRDRALVELMYGTGLRSGELAALTIAQLDLRRGIVRVPGRRRGAHEVPLNEPVRKVLRDYLRTLGPAHSLPAGTPVFRNPRGVAFTRQTIGKILAQRAQAAGIKKDVTGMTLRHSAATHLLARGIDRKGVAEFLGLASASELQTYLPREVGQPERRVS